MWTAQHYKIMCSVTVFACTHVIIMWSACCSNPPFQVKLLKDVLQEWKKEVEKKPPEMSVDQAYDTLGLKTGVGGYVFMVSIEFNCG